MTGTIADRFQNWLGTWRGPGERFDGTPALMELVLTNTLGGQVIQAVVVLFDPGTGRTFSQSLALWSLDRDGRVVCGQFSDVFGHTILHESPDDPDVLSLAGSLPGNVDLSVSLRLQDGVLELNSRASEGYSSETGGARITARLSRTKEHSA